MSSMSADGPAMNGEVDEEAAVEEVADSLKPIARFGVLGCANIARKVIRGMAMAEGVEAVAVGSRSLRKAKAFAKDLRESTGAELRAYGSYDEVLEDPYVDAVYIPLPTSMHVEWACRAAFKGKHLLLEKPPALTLEDLDKILDACGRGGLQVMDGTMWLHNPRARAVKDIIEDQQTFGDVLRISASFSILLPNPATNIRCCPDLDALGCLGDLGWYCIQFCLFVMDWDLPEEVVAQPGSRINKSGVVTSCGATLEWRNRCVASVDCSFEMALRQDVTVVGTKGVLRMDDFVIPMQERTSSFNVATSCSFAKNDTEVGTEYKDYEVEVPAPQEALMLREFARAVQVAKSGRGMVDVTWAEISRKTLLVVLAIQESLRQDNQAVVID